jgi:hypothetical protein
MDNDIRDASWTRAMEDTVKSLDGTTLDTRKVPMETTAGGVFLSWTTTGNVVLEVRKTTGINAVASGGDRHHGPVTATWARNTAVAV